MDYKEITPIAALQPFIKCFWVLKGEDPLPQPERIFPDGCMELIFHRTSSYSRLEDNKAIKQPATFIMGQATKALFFLPTPFTSIVSVRFQPFGLAAFTQLPPDEFTNTEVTLEHLWGKKALELEEKVNTLSTDKAIAVLQHFFFELLCQNKLPHTFEAISAISGIMKKNGGENTINYWAEQANLSERQFNRNFKTLIGISPKDYLKIVRFNKVLEIFNNSDPYTFGALAQQCGYYDQAHFIKDFKEYTGTTPKGFAKDSKVLIPIY